MGGKTVRNQRQSMKIDIQVSSRTVIELILGGGTWQRQSRTRKDVILPQKRETVDKGSARCARAAGPRPAAVANAGQSANVGIADRQGLCFCDLHRVPGLRPPNDS